MSDIGPARRWWDDLRADMLDGRNWRKDRLAFLLDGHLNAHDAEDAALRAVLQQAAEALKARKSHECSTPSPLAARLHPDHPCEWCIQCFTEMIRMEERAIAAIDEVTA